MLSSTALRIPPGKGLISLKRIGRHISSLSAAGCTSLQTRGPKLFIRKHIWKCDDSPLNSVPGLRQGLSATPTILAVNRIRSLSPREISNELSAADSRSATAGSQSAETCNLPLYNNVVTNFLKTDGQQSSFLAASSSLFNPKQTCSLPRCHKHTGTAERKHRQQLRGMASTSDAQVSTERKPSKVAVAQMRSTADIEANFECVAKLVKEAASAGCSMLFLPESFSFIGTRGSEGVAIAEQLDGPLMGRYRQLAREHSIWLSLGGFQESTTGPDRLHNTHVILNASGDIAVAYRKVHLFDVDVPNGPKLLESASTVPGSELVVTDCPAGRLGVTTCYDLRFPQMYQQLRFKLGAEILLVPSAFTKTTGEAHWEVLLRARAIECQCYVIAAAQAGRHNEKRESFGDALIIDPWGRIVARLDDPLAVGIATADIDLAYLQTVRTSIPVAQHRRNDIYGETVANESHGVRSTL